MKKTLAIILTAILALSMLTVGISAADAASATPANILGEAYTTKTVVSFDEADIASRYSAASADRAVFELGDGINGKALKMTPRSGTAEGYVTFDEQDWSGYDGLLYWVDLSKVNYKPDNTAKGQTGGVALRLYSNYVSGYTWTRLDKNPIEGHKIDTFYFENGEWKKSVNQDETGAQLTNGERINLPEKYVGWVYIPFTSYISSKGPDGTPVAGFYGDIGVGKIMVLSGPYTAADNQDSPILVDEIQLVKLGAATETQAPETQAPETQAPETQAPETQAPETQAPETQAPETQAPETQAPETQAPDTAEAPKGGCGSAIGASAALIAVAVLGTAVVSKKRR